MSCSHDKHAYILGKKEPYLQAHKWTYRVGGMTLAERIKAARKHAGLTQRQLAEAAKVEQPLISQLETGKTLKTAHIAQLAKACRVSALWLASGEGAMVPSAITADGKISLAKPWEDMQDGHSNVAPTLQPHREAKEYPLISWVAAGSWAESCVIPHRSAADEWLESSENAGLYGYWLEVKGRSMVDPSGQAAASFPPGMRILVQPEGFDVVSGKLYIARLRAPGGSWETTFKQYVRDAGVEYLQPLNPDFETLKIDENVEIIGRVIDARPPRSVF